MNPYAIQGKTKKLEPLDVTNFDEIMPLIANEDVRKVSLLYINTFNVMNSFSRLSESVTNRVFSENCRLFLIKGNDDNTLSGIIGLVDIDWQQLRCEIVLLMDRDSMIKKVSHEPLKQLLIKAIREWNFRKITMKIFDDDQWTKTVLKGFGFQEEGKLREQVSYRDDVFDVVVMGLLKNEFHFVED